MRRESRAVVYWPKRALVCAPKLGPGVGLNCAVVSTSRNCVWLNALYISNRYCIDTPFSPPIRKFLKTEMSQLLTPGPRIGSFGALPMPNAVRSGILTTEISKARVGDL